MFVAALVGLQLWAMAGYHDDWPFAANAMFAFPRDGSDPVYELRVLVHVNETWRLLDPGADLGLAHPEYFRRMFFSRYYGSTDPTFPQRSFSFDDRAHFEARLTSFCKAVARTMSSRGENVTALHIELDELHRHGRSWMVAWRRPIGACNPISAPFRSVTP